jgi:hypothetical protein
MPPSRGPNLELVRRPNGAPELGPELGPERGPERGIDH